MAKPNPEAVAYNDPRSDNWRVYDSCAEWCAKRGLKGAIGEPLPNLLDAEVHQLINDDPEAFERRVREMAYGIAMEKIAANYLEADHG